MTKKKYGVCEGRKPMLGPKAGCGGPRAFYKQREAVWGQGRIAEKFGPVQASGQQGPHGWGQVE